MRIILIACLLLVMAIGASPAGASWGDGFAQDDLSKYLQSAKRGTVGFEAAPDLRGKRMLTIKGATSAVFHRIPVQADAKYTLSFRGKTQAGETIEENPIFAALLHYNTRSGVFPRRQVRFFDAQGKFISMFYVNLPFGQWHDYVDVFYTPPQAAELEIAFLLDRADLALHVDDLKLSPTQDEGAINCNPVFDKLGLYNYSGLESLAAGAAMVRREDGVAVFDARYGSQTFRFPIHEPGQYALFAKAEANGYAPTIQAIFYDENNKSLGRVIYRSGRAGKPMSFTVPDGTRYGRLLMRSVVVEEIRFTRASEQ